MTREELAKTVLSLRKKRGLSQGRLAEKATLQLNQIYKIEKGLHSPSIETLNKVLAALDAEIVIREKVAE